MFSWLTVQTITSRLQLIVEGKSGRESAWWGCGGGARPLRKQRNRVTDASAERVGEAGAGGDHPVRRQTDRKNDVLIWLNSFYSVQDPTPGNGTVTLLWGGFFSTLIKQIEVILHRQA